MEIISLEKPNVLIIKNFITAEECATILNAMKESTEEQWSFQSNEKMEFIKRDIENGLKTQEDLEAAKVDIWKDMTLTLDAKEKARANYPHLPFRLLEKIALRMQKVTQEKFNEPLIVQLNGLHRWRVGREQQPHIDYYLEEEEHDFEMLERYNLPKEKLESFAKDFFDKHYSTLLYFNADYVGGELYMPQHDFEIKPEPGMLIAFKGDQDHLHGVKVIEEGIRYTWSIFWTSTAWAIKNPDRFRKPGFN